MGDNLQEQFKILPVVQMKDLHNARGGLFGEKLVPPITDKVGQIPDVRILTVAEDPAVFLGRFRTRPEILLLIHAGKVPDRVPARPFPAGFFFVFSHDFMLLRYKQIRSWFPLTIIFTI